MIAARDHASTFGAVETELYFNLRPYQQMQAVLLRKKLELLEHAVEHALEASNKNTEFSKTQLEEELLEIRTLQTDISKNGRRLIEAFTFDRKNP